MNRYCVPIECTVVMGVIMEADTKASAIKKAEKYWLDNYDKEPCFMEGAYKTGSGLLPCEQLVKSMDSDSSEHYVGLVNSVRAICPSVVEP